MAKMTVNTCTHGPPRARSTCTRRRGFAPRGDRGPHPRAPTVTRDTAPCIRPEGVSSHVREPCFLLVDFPRTGQGSCASWACSPPTRATDKVDLGVGVYRSPEGQDARHGRRQDGRAVDLGGAGDQRAMSAYPVIRPFLDAMRGLILGDAVPGGARRGLRHARRHRRGAAGAGNEPPPVSPDAAVWIIRPDLAEPSCDHRASRPEKRNLPLLTTARRAGIDRDGMLADLARRRPVTLILLSRLLSQPHRRRPDTGRLARGSPRICQRTGAIPFVDMAYLGFAESLEADAEGHAPPCRDPAGGFHRRQLFQEFRPLPGARAAWSSSSPPKAPRREVAFGTLANLNRQNYAFPARPRRAGRGDDPQRPDPAGQLAR